MTRTAYTVTALTKGVSAALNANDVVAKGYIDVGYATDKLVIHAKGDGTNKLTLTILAGNGLNSGQGNMVVEITTTQEKMITLLEPERFAQANGQLHINAAVSAGTIGDAKLRIIKI